MLTGESDRKKENLDKENSGKPDGILVTNQERENSAVMFAMQSFSFDNVQDLWEIWSTRNKNKSRVISALKSRTIAISKETIKYKIEIDGSSIEQVMEINYLGITPVTVI